MSLKKEFRHRLTPHLLRHGMALWGKVGGMPIDAVAQVLGHANPATTLRLYGRLQRSDVWEAYSRATAIFADFCLVKEGDSAPRVEWPTKSRYNNR